VRIVLRGLGVSKDTPRESILRSHQHLSRLSKKGWTLATLHDGTTTYISNTAIMSLETRKITLFGAAVGLRLLLATIFPGLPDLLTGRVEVSPPVSSFKRRESTQFSISGT
jgi:hypothetical protein